MGRKLLRSPAEVRAVQAAFLRLLRRGVTARDAVAMVRVRLQTIYHWRRREPEFDARWQRAVRTGDVRRLQRAMAQPIDRGAKHGGRLPRRGGRSADLPEARFCILTLLRQGARVWYAARRTGLGRMTVLQWRWRDPQFDADYRAAYQAGSRALLNQAARDFTRERRAIQLKERSNA